ncbi:hypothetical protein KC19_9G025500 [Ceratodon purpureus]|uniref:Uncharacterized protein n=1 Tax=Ceratodon purpureus TaxID=3225 RepID=A0A8T0GRJ3_CERPU|nr:hypothetical protein KC19_9G025500 [Ceratodon purpureus]
MTKKRDGLPKGVMCREATQELVCDVRFTHNNVKGKFHATQIESWEEGGFFYDIVKLYERSLGCGTKRKRPLELNYPEVSEGLCLRELPEGFEIRGNHKDQAQKLILEQARRAARELVQRQKCSRHEVGISQNTLNNQTSVHENTQGITPLVAENHLDLAGLRATHGVQSSSTHLYDTFQHNREHNGDQVHTKDFLKTACKTLQYCETQYISKVTEREDLERKVAGINDARGIISLPSSKPEKFYQCVAFIKRLIRRDGELFGKLEKFEQAYKSEESRCLELRKGLEDHNLKSISESLIGNQVGREVETVLHVIRSISELLLESPKDVLQNPWVPLFFSPDSNGGTWNMELENMSKILNNSPTWY